MNRTKMYRFHTLAVGQSITLPATWDHQHARVAASEHARRYGKCFTCRMQEDRTMIIYRVEDAQYRIDARGRNGRRHIPAQVASVPTEQTFCTWLATFTDGQSYTVSIAYRNYYARMAQWTIQHSIATNVPYSTSLDSAMQLVITR